jgi:hypothetical protein
MAALFPLGKEKRIFQGMIKERRIEIKGAGRDADPMKHPCSQRGRKPP